MFPLRRPVLLLLWSAMAFPAGSARGGDVTGPVPVELRKAADGSWQLARGGHLFTIKGAGGHRSLKLLAECGGNSVRTWGADQLDRTLDEAHRHGLTVTAGIWLGHERHGFDYNDPKQVVDQLERARAAIAKYKDHPAILMWGIGNEMEGAQGDNPAIWRAVNDIARAAKQLDSNHPTMTVVAELGGERVPSIHRLCPDINIIGVNAYGGGPTVLKRYREAGGTKPIVITEFGPNGPWESPKTSWGAPIEPSSTAKADAYRRTYESSTTADARKICLGSYAFLWGWKQEATATWFGMLLSDGSRTQAVDVMAELWTGRPPANNCPQIRSVKLGGDGGNAEGQVAAGAIVIATLDATDADRDDTLSVEWRLQREADQHVTGGDAQAAPPSCPDAVVRSDGRGATVRLPKEPGGYRLFVVVHDGRGGAAVANVPLLVRR